MSYSDFFVQPAGVLQYYCLESLLVSDSNIEHHISLTLQWA